MVQYTTLCAMLTGFEKFQGVVDGLLVGVTVVEVGAVGVDEEIVCLLEEGAEAAHRKRLLPFLRSCRWSEHDQHGGEGGGH